MTVPDCGSCGLGKGKHRLVNGVGPEDARIFFIGEAPGAKEDETGVPFVGKSGKFLDSVLDELGISRKEVFITNIVRCRPPGNRKPSTEEIKRCLPKLIAELKKVRPKVVITLGATATSTLTAEPVKMGAVVGKEMVVDFSGMHLTVVPCYHPSAAMRNRRLKAAFGRALSRAVAISR